MIGEALGQAYVARTFSPGARDRARAVIDDVRAAFGERLERLEWMSDSTRAQALAKLGQMGQKVGYPETWRDYSRLRVVEVPFVLNFQRAAAFDTQRVVNRPGSPVDKTEWEMTVPTVNAYYDPTKNEMVFPAGALAPQTFDPAADDAANYGSLGASWAGHELAHGFDDEGAPLRRPGEPARLVDPGLGGLLVAWDALQRTLQRNGRPGRSTASRRSSGSFSRTRRRGAATRGPRRSAIASPWAPTRRRCGG